MKHMIVNSLLCLLLIGGLLLLKQKTSAPSQAGITIGILQTAAHPALDAVRTQFMATLSATLTQPVTYVVRNGQGNQAQLCAAAESLVSNEHVAGFLTIGTGATEALTAREKTRPIIFSAVTVPDGEHPAWLDKNVWGVSDDVDSTTLLVNALSIAPTAKRIGIVYNTAETNSCLSVNLLTQACAQRQLTPVKIGVIQETDLLPALIKHLPSCDLLIAPTDNTVACAMTLVAREAERANCPFIVSFHVDPVPGVTATCGVAYTDNGALAAGLLADLLQKKPVLTQVLHQNSTLINHQKEQHA